MNTNKILMSIRFKHSTLKSIEITSKFNISPSINQSVGDKKVLRSGKTLEKINEYTYVVYEFFHEQISDVSEIIKFGNNFLVEQQDFINSFITQNGIIEYYITVSSTDKIAFELSSELIKQCSALNVKIGLEVVQDGSVTHKC